MVERAQGILPVSADEIMLRGIAAETTDRIVALKKADIRLRGKYESLANLEAKLKREGVSPDDHGLYTDVMEWRAVRHELSELMTFLEML
jgi:hypothetical protein